MIIREQSLKIERLDSEVDIRNEVRYCGFFQRFVMKLVKDKNRREDFGRGLFKINMVLW